MTLFPLKQRIQAIQPPSRGSSYTSSQSTPPSDLCHLQIPLSTSIPYHPPTSLAQTSPLQHLLPSSLPPLNFSHISTSPPIHNPSLSTTNPHYQPHPLPHTNPITHPPSHPPFPLSDPLIRNPPYLSPQQITKLTPQTTHLQYCNKHETQEPDILLNNKGVLIGY